MRQNFKYQVKQFRVHLSETVSLICQFNAMPARESKEGERKLSRDLEFVFVGVMKAVKDRYTNNTVEDRYTKNVIEDRYTSQE